MNYSVLKGKTIALLIIIGDLVKPEDMFFSLGEIIKEADRIKFVNDKNKWYLNINEETLKNIEKVPDELCNIFLGAKFFFLYSGINSNKESETNLVEWEMRNCKKCQRLP